MRNGTRRHSTTRQTGSGHGKAASDHNSRTSKGLLLLLWLSPAAALLTGESWLSPRGALAAPAQEAGQGGVSSPIATWAEDLADDLDDIDEDLDDAKAAVAGGQGPLSEPQLSQAADDLDRVLAVIIRILDPNQYPSLDPPNAGSVDEGRDPSSLSLYARVCSDLAQDALDEAQSAVIDHKVIGSHLKTIRYLITRSDPHNYRTKAGIATGD